nr:hypothetical protein [Tanacetum cinerariifolium]
FMNYLEEQIDREAMINLIKNGDQPLPRITQVSIAGTSSTEQPHLKDKSTCNKTAKDLWDALARQMLGSEYGEQDRKAVMCGYSKDNCELNFKFLNNLQPKCKQYATMMRQNKSLMDINIDALYNILKEKQGDVNGVMGLKKKTVVVTFDLLALIAEKTKVSKRKEKVVVSLDSEVSDEDDFSELKKITAFDKCKHGFMAHIEKVLSDLEASSSSSDENISDVSYYLPESKSESEYETSEYYDNTTTYGLFVNDNDDQEIFHDCEYFLENLIESQIDHNKSAIDHNDYERIDKLIRKFNKKIAKCLKHIEKANQQKKDFENQNKDLQDKYDV